MPVLLKRLGNIVTTALLVGSADTAEWYYADVQEATNSHDYERVDNKSPETWTKINPPRDWDALEKELAQKYPGK